MQNVIVKKNIGKSILFLIEPGSPTHYNHQLPSTNKGSGGFKSFPQNRSPIYLCHSTELYSDSSFNKGSTKFVHLDGDCRGRLRLPKRIVICKSVCHHLQPLQVKSSPKSLQDPSWLIKFKSSIYIYFYIFLYISIQLKLNDPGAIRAWNGFGRPEVRSKQRDASKVQSLAAGFRVWQPSCKSLWIHVPKSAPRNNNLNPSKFINYI
jgi:hypothetical protein